MRLSELRWELVGDCLAGTAVSPLIFTSTFMNLIDTAIQASPTAAVQLLTMPFASFTFVTASVTASLFLSTSRGGEKDALAAMGTHQAALRHRRAGEYRPAKDNRLSM